MFNVSREQTSVARFSKCYCSLLLKSPYSYFLADLIIFLDQ